MADTDIQKIMNFSPKFYCIRTDGKKYHLIPKEMVEDISQLKVADNSSRDERIHKTKIPSLLDVNLRLNKVSVSFSIVFMACVCAGIWYMSVPVVILLISLFLHELGHAGAAYIIGCREMVLGFRLQCRIVPILYISNRDLYECGYFARIFYYCGGVIINFILVFVSWVTIRFSGMVLLYT